MMTTSIADTLLEQIVAAETAQSDANYNEGNRHTQESAQRVADAAIAVSDLYRRVYRENLGGFAEHAALALFASYREDARDWASISRRLAQAGDR